MRKKKVSAVLLPPLKYKAYTVAPPVKTSMFCVLLHRSRTRRVFIIWETYPFRLRLFSPLLLLFRETTVTDERRKQKNMALWVHEITTKLSRETWEVFLSVSILLFCIISFPVDKIYMETVSALLSSSPFYLRRSRQVIER